MRFDYKRYRQERVADIDRPVIEVRNLRDPLTPAIAYEALVDSGSDRCIFPSEIADLLGIDLTKDRQRALRGWCRRWRAPTGLFPSRSDRRGPARRSCVHDNGRVHAGFLK